jgi:hypothetical protein
MPYSVPTPRGPSYQSAMVLVTEGLNIGLITFCNSLALRQYQLVTY